MDKSKNGRNIAIVGSTASGKSSLALAIAKELSGEIISLDSMQIYRGMDIGTAKPTKDELATIHHHMIDICDTTENFSGADYARLAKKCISEIEGRGNLPIFCGGTGLYLDCVLRGDMPEQIGASEQIRHQLADFLSENGEEALHNWLCEIDPVSGEAIHKNNTKRVMRAIEVYMQSGKPKSEWDRESAERPYDLDIFVISLAYHSRETLYERINKRVDIMMAEGLYDEVKRLNDAGVFEHSSTAAGAIGYKELLPAITDILPLEIAIENLKMATRRYAKRQMTWFGVKPYVHTLYCDDEDGNMRSFDEIFAQAKEMIKDANL